jgi:hypothetical protein
MMFTGHRFRFTAQARRRFARKRAMRAATSMDLDRVQGAPTRRRAEVDRHTA